MLFTYCRKTTNLNKDKVTDEDLQIKNVKPHVYLSIYTNNKIDHENGIIYAAETKGPIELHSNPLEDFELNNPEATMILLTPEVNINNLTEIKYVVAYKGKKKYYTLNIFLNSWTWDIKSLDVPGASQVCLPCSYILVYYTTATPPQLKSEYATPQCKGTEVIYEPTPNAYTLTRRGISKSRAVKFVKE